jgi:hypothetical protein
MRFAADLPLPVQVLVVVLGIVTLAGVGSCFAGVIRLMFRAGLALPPANDAKLPMGVQSYRAMSRAGELFTSPRYWLERRMLGYGILATAGSTAIVLVLLVIFGERT